MSGEKTPPGGGPAPLLGSPLSNEELNPPGLTTGLGQQARERLRVKESAALQQGREIHAAVDRMLADPKVRQVGPPVVIQGYLVRVTDHEPAGVLAQATAIGPAMGRLTPIVGRLDGIEVEGRHVPTAVLAALLKLSGWKVETP